MTYASLMVHVSQSRMDITMTVSNDLCQSNGACATVQNGYNDDDSYDFIEIIRIP